MNSYWIIGFGFVSIWDTVTTVYGTNRLMGGGGVQLVLSILFGLLIAALLLRTYPIMKNPKNDDLFVAGAKVMWFLAVGYDLYTSFTGNFDLVLGNAEGASKVIMAVGLTVFVSAAPIGLSKRLYDPD